MNAEHLTVEQQTQLGHARRAGRTVGLILPLILTVLGTLLFLIWLPRLPDPIAIHWGGSGKADGFGSAWMSLFSFMLVNLLVTALYFIQRLQSVGALRKPGTPLWGPINRLLPAIVFGTVVLIFVMEVGTTMLQLDLADARDMPSVNPTMLIGFGAAIVLGAVGFFAQPKLRIDTSADAEVGQALELAETERAVWFGVVNAPKVYWWIMGATNALTIGLFILVASTTPMELTPVLVLAGTTLLMIAVTLLCARFTVRIDDSGVQVTALPGWPKLTVPASDVERVEVGEINPLGEFGGWGMRWVGGGQVGVVMRTGEGIRIFRKSGKRLTITLDDAEIAAAVLTAVAQRSEADGTDPDPSPDDTRRETL